ncbi:glycoside hydrolase family 92 protein [Vibrio sp. S4M6]|uniref:glycoside hydrolase domain-containing protein n=1 Tax=Vibrio sinus TaxID=2946865 RepID=UPI00202A72BA|nr:glycoside hydrolase domain-containing protein [Vibrio sinus]MCL9779924.1 glycoside hydrolase family 92 protein [Vibrio sinus]
MCQSQSECSVSSSNQDIYIKFSFDANEVAALVGTSYTSEAQAKFNLENEVGSTNKITHQWKPLSFTSLVERNKQIWDEYLGRVQISGDNFSQNDFDIKLTSFYTALYRTLINPHAWFECSQYAQNGQCDASYTENKDGSRHYDYIFHRSPFDQEGFRNDETGNPLLFNGYMFSDEGTWDVYRSKYPFYSLVYPDIESNIIQGYINTYKEGGWLPKWASPGYKKSMTGTHGDCIVSDAYIRGIKGFSAKDALDAVWKDFSTDPSSSQHCLQGDTCGRLGYKDIKNENIGYVSSNWQAKDEHAAATLDFAYDDACIANMATNIAETTTDASLKALALERAQLAKQESQKLITNIFNSNDAYEVKYPDGSTETLKGLFLPKDSSGNWVKQGDLYDWGYGFNEGGPFQFMFYMQYDVPALAQMFASANGIQDPKMALEKQLDKFFTSISDGKKGRYGDQIHEAKEQQHIGLGQFGINNQPSFGYTYLYNYTNTPWKAQCILRNAMDPNRAQSGVIESNYACFEDKPLGTSSNGDEIYSLFGEGAKGWLGDEDTGSLSAWYASSAIGLHPVPGTDRVDFGSPIFNQITINVPAYDQQPAKELIIDAKNNSEQNIYVNKVLLNGQDLDLASSNYSISQHELTKNTQTLLTFEMSKTHE